MDADCDVDVTVVAVLRLFVVVGAVPGMLEVETVEDDVGMV